LENFVDKGQKCVLLIEDSEEAMFLADYALQEYGHGRYRLEWAKDLHEGLVQLSQRTADVVLLDLGLPETTGAASYAAVREMAPDIPVVVLSGDTSEETQVSVVLGGVYDYLGKEQISGGLLVEAIHSALTADKHRKFHTTA
jgi:DNA-binding response OmpR family regulator